MIMFLTLATSPDHNIFSLDTLIFRDRAMTAFLEIFYITIPLDYCDALTSIFDPLPSIGNRDFLIFSKTLLTPYNVGALGVIDG